MSCHLGNTVARKPAAEGLWEFMMFMVYHQDWHCSCACQKCKERAGFAEKLTCQLFMGNTQVVLGAISYWACVVCFWGFFFQVKYYRRFSFPRLYMFSWFVCKSGSFFADFQLQQCCSTELFGLITCLISFTILNFGSIVPYGYTTSTKVSKALVECF